MHFALYELPPYLQPIVKILSHRNWLIHNFNLIDENDLYNPANFLYNIENGTRYTLIVDLNIYQFLLNIIKKNTANRAYRDAACLLVYCQLSKIDIEPNFSVYEKINYNPDNISEALDELELFHSINNIETDELAKYALGTSSSVAWTHYSLDKCSLNNSFKKNIKLIEWDSMYLMILSIIDVSLDPQIPHHEKFKSFSDWMKLKFRKSLVATVYAAIWFSNKPIKKMMKFKQSSSPLEKKAAITNMTWDLYIMNYFFRKWTNKETNEEFMYASADKAFSNLLRQAIQIQITGDFSSLRKHLSEPIFQEYKNIINETVDESQRAYKSKNWNPDYRSRLISQFEQKLLY